MPSYQSIVCPVYFGGAALGQTIFQRPSSSLNGYIVDYNNAPPLGSGERSQLVHKVTAARDSVNSYFNASFQFAGTTDGQSDTAAFDLGSEGYLQPNKILISARFYLYDFKNLETVFSYEDDTKTFGFFQQISFVRPIFAPFVIGGGAPNSTLLLQSTTGAGADDSISLRVGNNGSKHALDIDHSGNATFGGFQQLIEQDSAPNTPPDKCIRLYAQSAGSGKTKLMALFHSGIAQQIAVQP